MSRKQLSQEVEQQLRKSLLSYAIFRPESALVIAMTIIFTWLAASGLTWFPGEWWFWILFGLLSEALIVVSTLRDQKFYQKLLDNVLRQEFDLTKLRSPELRQKVAKAIEYHELVVKEIKREEDPALDDYLQRMADSLQDWVTQIYRLAQGLDVYWHDPIIARDMANVPKELARFKETLARKQASEVRAELEKTIAVKQAQWETLQSLRDTMEKAQLQLENTLAAMGTVYTQVVLLGSKEVDSGRAQRLQEQMTEQVHALEDVRAAMDEVYQMS